MWLIRSTRPKAVTIGAGLAILTGMATAVVTIQALADGDAADAPHPACADEFPELGCVDQLNVADVPDEMRLLWSDDAAPAPTVAFATDQARRAEVLCEDGCPLPPGIGLVLVEEGLVTQKIDIVRAATPPPPSRLLEAGGIAINVQRLTGRGHYAWWTNGGADFSLFAEPELSDDELAELAAATHFRDGSIDISTWNRAGEFYFTGWAPDKSATNGMLGYRAEAGSLSLDERSTHQISNIWNLALLGNHVIEINGNPALVGAEKESGYTSVRWVPATGVEASLSAPTAEISGPDALVQIAETITPVPADDPRLTSAWQAEPDEIPVD
jgi:hypothetical protein